MRPKHGLPRRIRVRPHVASTAGPIRYDVGVFEIARGYCRWTDDLHQPLVLQFAGNPSADIVSALTEAGFEFRTGYGDQANVWIRHHDHQGRLHVEAIEKLIGTTPRRQSAAR